MTGNVYALGYAQPDSGATLQTLLAGDPKMLLVDIRYSPRSRWFPQWSKRRLQTTWADRYRHVKALGNVNYRLADAPIQLFDADAGIRWAVETLQAGHALILLCAYQNYEHCHRRIVKELIEETLRAHVYK